MTGGSRCENRRIFLETPRGLQTSTYEDIITIMVTLENLVCAPLRTFDLFKYSRVRPGYQKLEEALGTRMARNKSRF